VAPYSSLYLHHFSYFLAPSLALPSSYCYARNSRRYRYALRCLSQARYAYYYYHNYSLQLSGTSAWTPMVPAGW